MSDDNEKGFSGTGLSRSRSRLRSSPLFRPFAETTPGYGSRMARYCGSCWSRQNNDGFNCSSVTRLTKPYGNEQPSCGCNSSISSTFRCVFHGATRRSRKRFFFRSIDPLSPLMLCVLTVSAWFVIRCRGTGIEQNKKQTRIDHIHIRRRLRKGSQLSPPK